MKKICVAGSGAWGTALALVADRAGKQTILLARRPQHAKEMEETRLNQKYLPGIQLPETIHISANLTVLENIDCLILAVPAQHIRAFCQQIKPILKSTVPIVICAKGIEIATDQDKEAVLLSQVIQQVLPQNPIAVLSGPAFADEVAIDLPTAVTLAAEDIKIAKGIVAGLHHQYFRLYASDDLIGVQVCGAVKNVIAIACGIVHGKKLGNNAAASLMTRGLAEIRRLGVALGAKNETFLGLAAVGDLTLTCGSLQSRNMRLGKALGEGKKLQDILQSYSGVVEGVFTAQAIRQLALKRGISMPVCFAVYDILHEQRDIDETISSLLSRQLSLEGE